MKRFLLAAVSVCLFPSLPVFAASLPFGLGKTAKGQVLTDSHGMTLYTFAKDKTGMPTCYGACAQFWPPFLAAADAQGRGPYSLVMRQGGKRQWAFDGMPLYYFREDTSPGQVAGDGFKGLWHVVHPTQGQATTGGSSGSGW